MSIAVNDLRGARRVEPSVDVQTKAGPVGGGLLANPFVPILLARFLYGPSDAVNEFSRLGDYETAHDPEGFRGAASEVGRFVWAPGFNRTDLPGPAKVRTVRVGAGSHTPVQAYADLQSASPAAVIRITAIEGGTFGNGIRYKVAAGSSTGRKITLAYKDDPRWVVEGDNLGSLFALTYTGNASAAVTTVTRSGDLATRLQIALTGASDGSVSLDVDLTSPDFATCKQVFDYLNAQVGYDAVAVASDIGLADVPSSQIDTTGSADLVSGPYTFTAVIGAITAWVNLNASRIGPVAGVTAARTAAATAVPAAMAAFAHLGSGAQAATDATDWAAALAVIEREAIPYGMIVCDSEDVTVHALIQAWMEDQEAQGRIFRAAFGLPGGTTAPAARVIAGQINSKRIALFNQRLLDRRQIERSPMYWAAAFAGATGAMNGAQDPDSAVLTSRRFAASGITKADRFIKPVREASQLAGLNAFRAEVGQGVLLGVAVSTYQGPAVGLSPWEKWSETTLIDWIEITIREDLAPEVARWATPQYPEMARAKILRRLGQWRDVGVLTAGTDAETGEPVPAYAVPSVVVTDGAIYLDYHLGMCGEVDHARARGVLRRVTLSATITA